MGGMKARPAGRSPDLEGRFRDRSVARDLQTLADMIEIWCEGHHADLERCPLQSEAARLGIYRRRVRLCEECAGHLGYAEKRRALCPKDPKPFCAHCEIRCYRREEASWQRQVMRYSGPRSMWRGHFLDGLRHMLATFRHRRRWSRSQSDKPAGLAGESDRGVSSQTPQ